MTKKAAANTLYYGDNLPVMREYLKDESVDLVYLDPPFNSNQSYNVLFRERSGKQAAAQIAAFEDSWSWDESANALYHETVEGSSNVSPMLRAYRTALGTTDMLAYLTMMAPRLVELHRVLKPTGSLYLHCDPTASHYLKLLLDAVFGPKSYRADIRWKRTSAHGNALLNYAYVSDQILFYTKGDQWTWNPSFQPLDPEYIASHYSQVDEKGRRFTTRDLTASMSRASSGQLYDWKGIRPVSSRCWSFTKDNMEEFERDGLLVYGKSGVPRLKLYLDDAKGTPVSDLWDDISPINSQSAERLGYPTQKPEALLDRILTISSNVGEVVLDPFCGCGTTVASAQRLGRRWIGIDITHMAIGLIRNRLVTGSTAGTVDFAVIGEPTTLDDARELAETNKFQFQAWALGLVGARTAAGEAKKGADRGIDGRLIFHGGDDDSDSEIILSVKGGHLKADDVRALDGVRRREGAELGVLISFETPTKKMYADAASFGMMDTPWGSYQRIQLLTVGGLLDGKRIQYPAITEGNRTLRAAKSREALAAERKKFNPAPKKRDKAPQPGLFGDEG